MFGKLKDEFKSKSNKNINCCQLNCIHVIQFNTKLYLVGMAKKSQSQFFCPTPKNDWDHLSVLEMSNCNTDCGVWGVNRLKKIALDGTE